MVGQAQILCCSSTLIVPTNPHEFNIKQLKGILSEYGVAHV